MLKRKSAYLNYSNLLSICACSNFIQRQTDSSGAALQIARNFICLVRELERKQVFVEDFHGSHFVITSDMSVSLIDYLVDVTLNRYRYLQYSFKTAVLPRTVLLS